MVLKINFFSVAIGSLLLTPFIYIFELTTSKIDHVGGGLLDVFSIAMWAVIMGIAAVAMGLIAYPLMRWAHGRGLLKF